MQELTTSERLENYRQALREFEAVKEQKLFYQKKISTLKAVDYSGIKVTQGNRKKSSDEEIYTQRLERANAKIKDYIQVLRKEKIYLLRQISRLNRWEYEQILLARYLENWEFKEIVSQFFEHRTDFETEEVGQHGKYWDTIMRWHRQALKQVNEISKTLYIPTAAQLHLIDFEKEGEEK